MIFIAGLSIFWQALKLATIRRIKSPPYIDFESIFFIFINFDVLINNLDFALKHLLIYLFPVEVLVGNDFYADNLHRQEHRLQFPNELNQRIVHFPFPIPPVSHVEWLGEVLPDRSLLLLAIPQDYFPGLWRVPFLNTLRIFQYLLFL